MISSHIGFYPWSERWKPQSDEELLHSKSLHASLSSVSGATGAASTGASASTAAGASAVDADQYRNVLWSSVPLVRLRQQHPMSYMQSAHQMNLFIAEQDGITSARQNKLSATATATATAAAAPSQTVKHSSVRIPALKLPLPPAVRPPGTGAGAATDRVIRTGAGTGRRTARPIRTAARTASGSATARVPAPPAAPATRKEKRSFVTTYEQSIGDTARSSHPEASLSGAPPLVSTHKTLKVMRDRIRGRKTFHTQPKPSADAAPLSRYEMDEHSYRLWSTIAPFTRPVRYRSIQHDTFRPVSSRTAAEVRASGAYSKPPVENRAYRDSVCRQVLTERDLRDKIPRIHQPRKPKEPIAQHPQPPMH